MKVKLVEIVSIPHYIVNSARKRQAPRPDILEDHGVVVPPKVRQHTSKSGHYHSMYLGCRFQGCCQGPPV